MSYHSSSQNFQKFSFQKEFQNHYPHLKGLQDLSSHPLPAPSSSLNGFDVSQCANALLIALMSGTPPHPDLHITCSPNLNKSLLQRLEVTLASSSLVWEVSVDHYDSTAVVIETMS